MIKSISILFIVIGCIAVAGIASGGNVEVNISVGVQWNGFF